MGEDALEMMLVKRYYVLEVNDWRMYTDYETYESGQSPIAVMKVDEGDKVKYDEAASQMKIFLNSCSRKNA